MDSTTFTTNLPLTFGVVEIGVALAIFHSGMTMVQAGNYFRMFPGDSTLLKALVVAISGTDILHTGLIVHAVYYYTIQTYGDPQALSGIVWSLQATILLVGLSMLVVRTYFCAVRVYRLTSSALAAIVCWVPALVAAAINLSVAISVFIDPSWSIARTYSFIWRLTAIVCLSAATDVLVACCICYGLFKLRSGFSASDQIVDKLIICTVGSGLLTSVASVIQAVTYLTMDNFLFLAFYILIAKLVNNSLLASLNERKYSRQTMTVTRAARMSGDGSSTAVTRGSTKRGHASPYNGTVMTETDNGLEMKSALSSPIDAPMGHHELAFAV
ncbi:hypothetical protein EXIGLDRAFT_837795 [Exidia glandulosa HHB12029]|uniref:DUF6534 domain-containing protein n=1 Tax=Exidia glandulosa HHB12029 TaxID=1314781 RepID=A0A165GG79_EXIGL|nr:hypothetical protein EXIGLDRAFT_837795 [Exidia glandulosa HHB12029]